MIREKLASKVGIGEEIDWIKEISRAKLLQHYKSTNIFITLSEHEAYGIVVAEALASGTPCIVAKAGALSEFVDDEMCIEATLPIEIGELVEISLKSIRTDGKQDERRDFMVKKWMMSLSMKGLLSRRQRFMRGEKEYKRLWTCRCICTCNC